MVGGGFYEPILIAIPPEDRREQITRLADYIEKHFERSSARRVAHRARLGAANSFVARAGRRRIHARRRQSFPRRRLRPRTALRLLPRRRSRPHRQGPARSEVSSLPDSLSRRQRNRRLSARRRRQASGRLRGHGRRPRKIRRLARHPRALLHQRLARAFLRHARAVRRLALDRQARRTPSRRARRSAAPSFRPRPTPK